MTVRRRSRRRPLTEFAARSPLHAIGVWLLRSALIALTVLAIYLLIVNVLVPDFADRMVEQLRTPQPMLIALILILVGIVLIVSNPILGLIPGILLIVIGLVVAGLAVLGRGIGAIAGIGSKNTCPECRSKIPADATVCRHCGYRYAQP